MNDKLFLSRLTSKFLEETATIKEYLDCSYFNFFKVFYAQN